MKIINVPIESLEERYSLQWNYWFPMEFMKHNIDFITVGGSRLQSNISVGSFLDVIDTNYYKASQLEELCVLFHKGEIKDGDVIFFHDLWFPGIEMLQYIRQGLHLNFKIMGILHAGTWDENDFLSRKGMTCWAEYIENGWFRFIDKIFVATEYHKRLLLSKRILNANQVVVTGLPIYPDEFVKDVKKENIIIFPHRLDPEKQPQLFDRLAVMLRFDYPNWKFVKTKEVCKNKKEYYDLLNRAKIAVSFAKQETFGIAMLESLFCGCIPVVPDRLSYSELFANNIFLRHDDADVISFVEKLLSNSDTFYIASEQAKVHARDFAKPYCESAISKMLEVMK